jgi:hypothetical protein
MLAVLQCERWMRPDALDVMGGDGNGRCGCGSAS